MAIGPLSILLISRENNEGVAVTVTAKVWRERGLLRLVSESPPQPQTRERERQREEERNKNKVFN